MRTLISGKCDIADARTTTTARRKPKLIPSSSSSTVTTLEDEDGNASDEGHSSSDDCNASNSPASPVVLPEALRELQRLTIEHGPWHDSVAEAWNSLGLIRLHMQRDASAALECHQRALEIYDANQTAASLQVAIALNDCAMCYERLDDRIAALSLYEQALAAARTAPCAAEKLFLFRSTERAISRLSHK